MSSKAALTESLVAGIEEEKSNSYFVGSGIGSSDSNGVDNRSGRVGNESGPQAEAGFVRPDEESIVETTEIAKKKKKQKVCRTPSATYYNPNEDEDDGKTRNPFSIRAIRIFFKEITISSDNHPTNRQVNFEKGIRFWTVQLKIWSCVLAVSFFSFFSSSFLLFVVRRHPIRLFKLMHDRMRGKKKKKKKKKLSILPSSSQ